MRLSKDVLVYWRVMDSPSRSANAQLCDHPDLQPLILHSVTLTGKTLGSGSYGTVEEVTITGALCAAKKIHDFLTKLDPKWLAKDTADSNMQNFVSECKMMNRLRHPNIVQFLGIWISQSDLYLVMEKMLTSLHDMLEPDDQPKHNIPLGLKYSILQDIVQGLAYLHKQNPPVIHRDLSARNVLLNSAMVAKIADMGIARIVPDKNAATMTKQPGASVYMPPEALEDRYDTAIDLFSLGVVAMFLLTQEFPQDLKPATYTDEVKGTLVARTELERREIYAPKLYCIFPKSHPLIQLVESCLENSPKARPSIDQALELVGQAVATIRDKTHIISKLELLQLHRQQQEMFKRELESVQQKYSTLREEVESLSPLRNEVDNLRAEVARLHLKTTRRQISKEMVFIPPHNGKLKRSESAGDAMTSQYHSDDGHSKLRSLSTSRQKSNSSCNDHVMDSRPKPHERMETWYTEINRDQAAELLRNSKNGTFLCRLSSEQATVPEGGIHTHTIDIVCGNDITHMRVIHHNGRYRLSNTCYSFDSVMDLVLHYSEHSVSVVASDGVTATLMAPRFCNQ